jgi:hypothetical protein
LLEREGEIGAILFSDCGQRQHGIRNIHPLSVRKCSANQAQSVGELGTAGFNAKPNLAVIDEQFGTRAQRIEDFGMRQWRTASVAALLAEVEAKAIAGPQLDPALGEGTEPELWTLQISKNADRAPRRALDRADRCEPGLVILVRPVAEIEPEYVYAGFEQITDSLGRRTRWAECRDDLGAAEAPCVHLHAKPLL